MATVSVPFDVGAALVGTSNIPELITTQGTNFPILGYAFGAANEAIFFRFTAQNYGSGNVTLLLDWYARTGAPSSGSVTWGGALSVLTPSDATNITTDSYATENTQSSTQNSTSNGFVRATLVISNLDSLAAGDTVSLRVRITSNTMASSASDAVLFGVTATYSDT
jgi:hypothetical protein